MLKETSQPLCTRICGSECMCERYACVPMSAGVRAFIAHKVVNNKSI